MKAYIYITLFIIIMAHCTYTIAQEIYEPDKKQDTTELTYFYFESGVVSSVGYLEDGRPNGYWKTFHENGVIKSEGNRKNFMLDSLWKFYNEKGELILEVNYKKELKHGLRRTYHEDGIIEEYFKNDVLHGPLIHYFADGQIRKEIFYEDGKREGISKKYAQDGTVIVLTEYRNDIIVSRENINRKDRNNNKQGTWKYFYENGQVEYEGFYVNGQKNGFFKYYNRDGSLNRIEKFVEGVLQKNVPEIAKHEIKTDYYPSGRVRVRGSYLDGVAHGIRREYTEDGEVEMAYIFEDGIIIAEGIIDPAGRCQGYWKKFYRNGRVKAEGHFTNNIKTGEWKYYEEEGYMRYKGSYNENGFQTGAWNWFYEDGQMRKIENFRNGKLDGLTKEFDTNGNTIAKGHYIDGYEDGFWIYITNNYRREGHFSYGRKTGEWNYFYDDGTLRFTGEFLDDYPDGRHFYYWDNGRVKEERNYIVGTPDGVWRRYTPEGLLFIFVDHKRGIEYRYDGVLIQPTLD